MTPIRYSDGSRCANAAVSLWLPRNGSSVPVCRKWPMRLCATPYEKVLLRKCECRSDASPALSSEMKRDWAANDSRTRPMAPMMASIGRPRRSSRLDSWLKVFSSAAFALDFSTFSLRAVCMARSADTSLLMDCTSMAPASGAGGAGLLAYASGMMLLDSSWERDFFTGGADSPSALITVRTRVCGVRKRVSAGWLVRATVAFFADRC